MNTELHFKAIARGILREFKITHYPSSTTSRSWIVTRKPRTEGYSWIRIASRDTFVEAFRGVSAFMNWPKDMVPEGFKVISDPWQLFKRHYRDIYPTPPKALAFEAVMKALFPPLPSEVTSRVKAALKAERATLLEGLDKRPLRFVYNPNKLSPLEFDILNHYRFEMLVAGASKRGDYANPVSHRGGFYPDAQEAAFKRFVHLGLLHDTGVKSGPCDDPRFIGTEKLKAWHETLLLYAARTLPEPAPRGWQVELAINKVPLFEGHNQVTVLFAPRDHVGDWTHYTPGGVNTCHVFHEGSKNYPSLSKLASEAVRTLPNDCLRATVKIFRGDGELASRFDFINRQ